MSYRTPVYPCADCGRLVSEDSGEVMVGGFCEDCAPHHPHDIHRRDRNLAVRIANAMSGREAA